MSTHLDIGGSVPTVVSGGLYKWYLLLVAALTHTLVVAMPTMSIPVLFEEIGADLGLSLVEIGVIWGTGALTSMFMAVAGGIMGDRLGARNTLVIACLLAGLTGVLRSLAVDFRSLAVTVFLAGLLMPVIPTNVHKTVGTWFLDRHLGLANGVVSMGMALGFMLGALLAASVLSPWLGSWRNVIRFYALIALLFSLLWATTRHPSAQASLPATATRRPALGDSLRAVARLRNIWLLGLAMMGIGGCIQGTLGYLPLYLRSIGWQAAAADGTLAAFHGVSLLCTVPVALISDHLGNRLRVLTIAGAMIATGVGLLSIVQGLLIVAAVLLAGMVRDGFMATLMTQIVELRGVGPALAGTATGLIFATSTLGNVVAPPLGNSLAAFSPSAPFMLWALMALASLMTLRFVDPSRT